MTGRLALAVSIAVVVLVGGAGVAAANETASLGPEAQLSFEKALVAIDAKDWKLAITYLLEAGDKNRDADGQRAVPPNLLFNLGLGYARTGDQLTAIALLQAYLAANPRAANAPAVRTEIARLEAAAEVKVRSLLQIYAGFLTLQDRSSFAYGTWVTLLAKSHALGGNIDEAGRSFRTFNVDPAGVADATRDKPVLARDLVAIAHATHRGFSGDLHGAREALSGVGSVQKADDAWCNIAGFWGAQSFRAEWTLFALGGLDAAVARAAAQQVRDPAARQKCLERLDSDHRMKAMVESRALFRLPGRPDRGAGSPSHRWQHAAWGLRDQCMALDCDDLESMKGGHSHKEFRYPMLADYVSGGLLYLRALQKATAEPAR